MWLTLDQGKIVRLMGMITIGNRTHRISQLGTAVGAVVQRPKLVPSELERQAVPILEAV